MSNNLTLIRNKKKSYKLNLSLYLASLVFWIAINVLAVYTVIIDSSLGNGLFLEFSILCLIICCYFVILNKRMYDKYKEKEFDIRIMNAVNKALL